MKSNEKVTGHNDDNVLLVPDDENFDKYLQ